MSSSTEGVQARLRQVHERMNAAARAAGRAPDAVRLLAVSKTFGLDAVLAAAAAGQRTFGENYVQEAVDKILAARAAGVGPLEWHFIGPLQSNKTRPVAAHFDWVESVDRLKVAQRLSDQRPPQLAPLQVLIEVNISGEASKAGVTPAELPAVVRAVAALPRLTLRGLMAIPEPQADPALARAPFAALRALFEQMRPLAGDRFDTLSMGMSADLDAAIAEGSTEVRIGTAIFGARAARPAEAA